MKQWWNGLFVGLAIGFIVSILYRSQQQVAPAKAVEVALDKELNELEDWWKKLSTERKIDLEISRIEDESRLDLGSKLELEDDEGEQSDET